ncbi:MAG TPA: hypothetical protein VFY51_10080, partial [Pyrinomonadaceae bacterium]|nr:hypothetical protein [Pyrinomonadaceae bacterium]
MKKCPQCEFIYEDDQSLCDMDGVLLVFDTRTLPNAHALATVSAPIPGKTARRNRMVPAFATLVVMVAVASVYYVSTMRNAASTNFSPASVTSTSVEAPAPVVVPPAPTPAEVETPKEEPRETHAAPDARPASPPAQPSSAAARPAAPPPNRKATTTTPATPKAEPKKEDSKVES